MTAIMRRHVFFSGQVQGVGFRYSTHRIASNYDVTGFVRNLPDGRVELVAEGDTRVLDDFVQQILNAMEHQISSHTSDTLAAAGNFLNFEIRY